MRHHCGGRITIQTDPKAGDYVVTQGARRKVESYKAEDAQTVEIPDAAERAAVSADPLARLEHSTASAARAAGGRATLVALARDAAARGTDPYSLNKQLRAALRASKKSDAQLDERCVLFVARPGAVCCSNVCVCVCVCSCAVHV